MSPAGVKARGDAREAAHRVAFALIASGVGHFAAPARFDSVLPAELPGNPRCYTHVSGFAEVLIGTLLLIRRTRRVGGLAALAFFVLVTPVIVNGVRLAREDGGLAVWVAVLRLPLQITMTFQALKILRNA